MKILDHNFIEYKNAIMFQSFIYLKCNKCSLTIFKGSDENWKISKLENNSYRSGSVDFIINELSTEFSCKNMMIKSIIE